MCKPLTRCPHGNLLESYSRSRMSCVFVHVVCILVILLVVLVILVQFSHPCMFHKEIVTLSEDLIKLPPRSKSSKDGSSEKGSFSKNRLGELNDLSLYGAPTRTSKGAVQMEG